MKLVKCEFRNSPWKNIVFRTICYLWLKAMQCAVDSHQTNRWGWFLLSLWAWQSVQFSRSVMSDFLQPHGLHHTRIPVLHHLPELAQTHVHWVNNAIQPSHPLLSPSPSFNLAQRRVFSNEPVLQIRWPNYWSFSFNISPSNEHWGLISFRKDWLDLPAVQGTLKSLLQHHS